MNWLPSTIIIPVLLGLGHEICLHAADPSQHWAFRPLNPVTVPGGSQTADAHSIDAFIHARLADTGLSPNPPADSVTLIRRLYLDLHGLPPAPEEIHAFANSTEPQAYSKLVENLLRSPRYGERWAQHWLDIVRYADTHGYEVNTPRAQAWPYRDYVIRAFNEDKPYDQFVLEQLAGDTVQEDAATGFMVAAAALLPGQIGQDDVSKRLARQDELDEIIVGTSETFLALSVGCSRCHDHKFDPISQKDYYTMQAFFAGVDYGERPLNDQASKDRQQQAKSLDTRLASLKQKLNRYEPGVYPGHTLFIDDEDLALVTLLADKNGHGTNPAGKGRGYRDDQGSSTRFGNLSGGRYTWWNNKPGQDVFTYNPHVEGLYHIWISWGVHGSGVHTRDARYVLDLDGNLETRQDQKEIAAVDQYYFAHVREGVTEKQPLWSGLLHAGVHELSQSSRVILRGGQTGTGITADVIVLQETGLARQTTALPRLRPAVNAERNEERFTPREARFIRFTTLETDHNNQHEPCLDELEVFATGSEVNLALAEHGTRPSSSGNHPDPGRHELKHINDGRYGNGRSWISATRGGGWVQLELEEPRLIDRVVWGRDRDKKFKDRLPVRYRIELALEPEEWITVAGSMDREPYTAPHDKILALSRNLPPDAAPSIQKLITDIQDLDERRQSLDTQSMVFAGKFRPPDVTRVLHRGDPEQPLDPVAPEVLHSLGDLSLPPDAPDQTRRLALARWITNPANPLTARVMANRIWQYHFGRGLVDTPSDFGFNGSKPSHPRLLDWLALEFINAGWSVKHLHRLILNSATYRQSSQINPQARKKDAEGRLFWRFTSRRLEAEAIRDSMLQINGRLNLKMGGPGFDFFKSRGGLNGFPPVEEFGPDKLRRMIYAHKIRMERVPIFGAFDCPDAGRAMPHRKQSTTAIQALNLFNSPFVAEQSRAFAQRILEDTGPDSDRTAQVQRAFRLALGRPPREIEQQTAELAVRDHGLLTLCRVLYNSSEFLFIP